MAASRVGLHTVLVSSSLVLQTLLLFLLLVSQVEQCSSSAASSAPSNNKAKDAVGGQCDQGWVQHDNFCYLFITEYEYFKHADLTCSLYHATQAYAYDKSSYAFLTSQVAKGDNKKVYGWWYGAKGKGPMAKQLKVMNETGGYEIGQLPKSAPNLTMASKILPSNGHCFGWRYGYGISKVPCAVNLPYICRGDPNTVSADVVNDVAHFVNGSKLGRSDRFDDVFWISGPTDRRSYDDAKKACESKSMTLFSIRNMKQHVRIVRDIVQVDPGYSFIDPWWIGLKAEKGVYSWDSGLQLEENLLDPNNKMHDERLYGCYILLSDGTFKSIRCHRYDRNQAPFICRKPTTIENTKFGCPSGWYRGGRSCYSKASSIVVDYNEAWSICSKFEGAHVLSINSATEKTWLLKSSVNSLNSATEKIWRLNNGRKFKHSNSHAYIWTSLNDKVRFGDLRLADGSRPDDPAALDFVSGFERGRGDCFIMRERGDDKIERIRCFDNAIPGCQYTPTKNASSSSSSCVTKDWMLLNGICYYVPDMNINPYKSWLSSKYTMLEKCQAAMDNKYDPSTMKLRPLKIDSKSVYDLYFKTTRRLSAAHAGVWLGLRETGYSQFSWHDGTPLDERVYQQITELGNERETKWGKRCTVLSLYEGGLRFEHCVKRGYASVICEIEMELLEKASGNASVLSPGGRLTSYFFIGFVFRYLLFA